MAENKDPLSRLKGWWTKLDKKKVAVVAIGGVSTILFAKHASKKRQERKRLAEEAEYQRKQERRSVFIKQAKDAAEVAGPILGGIASVVGVIAKASSNSTGNFASRDAVDYGDYGSDSFDDDDF